MHLPISGVAHRGGGSDWNRWCESEMLFVIVFVLSVRRIKVRVAAVFPT
jgi:hypothetical protein